MASLGPVIVTPLAGNELFFRSLSGDEAMSGLYEYTVQVLSRNPSIKLADALGENMTVSVHLTGGGLRHYNGFITRFSHAGVSGTFHLYRAVIHPWLWFLGRTADCRIFQNQTPPDIVKKIFRKHPVHLFDEALDPYSPREYLVQYRETDLNFVSRLLEHEGISYHFAHDLGKHTLVLTDSSRRRDHVDGYKVIPLRGPAETGQGECFTSWHITQEVDAAAYVLKDFDYLKPKAPLASARAPAADPDLHVQGEIYDYPGQYKTSDEGDKLVAVRLQQAQSFYETIEAHGTVRGIGAGNVFAIDGPLSNESGREFLVVKAHYEIHGHGPESAGEVSDEESFNCSVTAVDSKLQFRPARTTPIPIVQGPQTAIVVGPKKEDPGSEEIWTDEQGRVLVKFHWERLGELKPKDPERADEDADNEKAPCWLRVAQLWAGAGWGTLFIPRIGQEVMVEFLEGDPDRPIVTGRVYNQDNKPPYLDEHKKTQSGIRTHSSPGGGPKNFNEIRFEDKKGAEELFTQAERNQTTHVKASRSTDVGGSDSLSVGGDRTVHVKGNLSTTVDGGGKGPVHNVNNVTGKYSLHASDTIEIDAPTHILFKCGGSSILIEPGKITLEAGGKAMVVLDAHVLAQSSDQSKVVLDANALVQSSGGSKVVLDGDAKVSTGGDVHVDGTKIQITGTSEAVVKAGSGSVKTSGPGVEVVGATIKLNG